MKESICVKLTENLSFTQNLKMHHLPQLFNDKLVFVVNIKLGHSPNGANRER